MKYRAYDPVLKKVCYFDAGQLHNYKSLGLKIDQQLNVPDINGNLPYVNDVVIRYYPLSNKLIEGVIEFDEELQQFGIRSYNEKNGKKYCIALLFPKTFDIVGNIYF